MTAGDRVEPVAISPHPLPTEHPAGYQRRLAEANGLSSLRQLYRLHGIERLSPRSMPETWERLRRATGIEMTRLTAMAWSNIAGPGAWLSVWGRPVRHRHLDMVRLRHCPQCLAIDSCIRAEWSLIHMLACALHGTLLTDACIECGKPMRLAEQFDIWRCGHCGLDRREAVPPGASPAQIALSSALSAAFAHRPAGNREADSLPVEFARLGVGNMAVVLDRLLRITSPPETAPTKAGQPVALDAMERAHAVLAQWPDRYDELLIDLADVRDSRWRAALLPTRDHRGRPIAFLADRMRHVRTSLLGERPRERAPGLTRGFDRGPAASANAKPVSHSAAMLRLEGRGRERLARWWVEAGLLTERIGADGRLTLRADEVAGAAALLAQVAGRKPRGAVPSDIRWVDRCVATGDHYGKDDFLRDLIDGRIAAWRSGDGEGLAGLAFDRRDVERLRSLGRLRAWIAGGHHVALSRFNAEAEHVWDAGARLAIDRCDKLAAKAKLRMTMWHPPAGTGWPQKRWHVADLVRCTQQRRATRLDIDAIEAEALDTQRRRVGAAQPSSD